MLDLLNPQLNDVIEGQFTMVKQTLSTLSVTTEMASKASAAAIDFSVISSPETEIEALIAPGTLRLLLPLIHLWATRTLQQPLARERVQKNDQPSPR